MRSTLLAATEPSPRRSRSKRRRTAVLDYGFRPFFLLAAIYGAAGVVAWLGQLAGLLQLAGGTLWHGHEMLFGFATAALAGFLLTAVPNWTGTAPLRNGWLLLLCGAWAIGRTAMWMAALPASLVAVMDLVFLPLLAGFLAVSLLRSGNRRNLIFLAILAALFASNLAFHLEATSVVAGAAFRSLHVTLDLFALMIAIVGGRIVPAFTRNALRAGGSTAVVSSRPFLDAVAVLTVAGVTVLDTIGFEGSLSAWLAVVAAGANALRMAGWSTAETLDKPILGVLHLGYAWLVIGLIAKSAAHWDLLAPATALHAWSIGAVGTMTMAVMSRAALGHTGRALRAPPLTVAAYLLVSAATLVRLAVPPSAPEFLGPSIMLSGALWTAAWLAFLVDYAPILIRPRPDGQPG